MPKEGEAIVIREYCRVPNAAGLKAVDAAQRLALAAGECPRRGLKSRAVIYQKYGTRRADDEIIEMLPQCQTCVLRPQASDFNYSIPNPSEADDDLPAI